ncbi:unnamed protein product [Schistosoma rodhaini]|uniref:Uncharacterized protein n=1 Tax=Schistosoma rodhaini TaxID=6188 RepID=A0AA85FDC2_9TREM|nr:unnamed protein product [Schistosoma rodhaini]
MSFKIPRVCIQRKLFDANLDGFQNNQNSQDISSSVQPNSSIHQSKDEFEDQSSHSHSEYNSSFWTSLRNIWKHSDREDTSSITEKDDEHNDELKLSNLLSDINETTDYLMNKISISEKIIEYGNLNGNSLKTISESVKQLSYGKNIIIDKQNYLNAFSEKVKEFPLIMAERLDRIFSKVDSSMTDESRNFDRLPASSRDDLEHAVVTLRNKFRSLQESSNRDELRLCRNILRSDEVSTQNKKEATRGPNKYMLSSTGSGLSIHMKFRTPLSIAARKPNIRSVSRLTNHSRQQEIYIEDYANHRTRKTSKSQLKDEPNYYRNADYYIHSPETTSDSSDCISLSSISEI